MERLDSRKAATGCVSLGRSQCYPLFFPQQDHVGGVLGAGDSESFSIRRPSKFGDVFGSEVGDLVSGPSVERLHENVIHALIANDVSHGFSVRSEAHRVGETSPTSRRYPWIGLKQDGGGLRARV